MLAADTSALISLSSVDLTETVLAEFDVHTTRTVVQELEATADYDDVHGDAARIVLDHGDEIAIHDTDPVLQTSRIDEGEGSVAALAEERDVDFLLTDDLRALPELQNLVQSQVAISPLVLRALVKRDALEDDVAEEKLETLARHRDWLGAPIYRRAKALFS